METLTHKILYYQNKDGKLETEYHEGRVYIHNEVYHWSPSIARFFYSVLHTLFEELKQKGISQAYAITPNPRYAKMFGATPIKKIMYKDIEHEVVKWELK